MNHLTQIEQPLSILIWRPLNLPFNHFIREEGVIERLAVGRSFKKENRFIAPSLKSNTCHNTRIPNKIT